MATVRHSTVVAILLGFLALCDASTVLPVSTVTSTIQPATTTAIATPAPAVSSAFSAESGSAGKATSSGPITTAPIFLPYYDKAAWDVLRGSILSSNDVSTTYTIFCLREPKQACDLALEFPFIIIEGPKTIEFHGTWTSTFIADIGCAIDGGTAAVCSGYSSLKSGYNHGLITGPTELSWTSTLTGTDVTWANLTLTDAPKRTGDDNDSADETMVPPKNTALLYLPSETPESAARTQDVQAWAAIVVAASTIFAGLLL